MSLLRVVSRGLLFTALLLAAALAQGGKTLIVRPRTGPYAGRTFYRNSHALVIGISDYARVPKLSFAHRDAAEMARVLITSYGFLPENVTLLLNGQATKAAIEAALADLGDDERVGREDRILVFFSGHGQTVPLANGGVMGFLIPYDADVDLSKPQNRGPYLRSCLPMDAMWRSVEASAAKHALLVADACFSGVLARSRNLPAAEEAPNAQVVAELLARPAQQVLTAGGQEQEAKEQDALGHGVFTHRLLGELRARAANPDRVFTASALAARVKTAVANVTNGRQTPQFGSHNDTEGEFLFVTTEPQEVRLPPPPVRPKVEPERPKVQPLPVRPNRPLPGRSGTQAGEIAINPADGAELVWVPPGTFTMGSDTGDADEKPPHRVTLTQGYWLYRTEVTNSMYAKFLAAKPTHPKPSYWTEQRFNLPQQPVVGVSWNDAVEYCKWAGVRLPTEAEWEYAARGTDGRTYPWGNQAPDATRAVFGQPFDSGRAGLVGRLAAGASWCGALDMAGNVWEWCADWFDAGYYAVSDPTDPTGSANGSSRVLRGGSWYYDAFFLRASGRYNNEPGFRYGIRAWGGFRPARTP